MKKTTSGFTIVELLIVIVVIAILAAISTIAYTGIQDRARQAKAQSSAKQAATKLRLYNVENGNYPTTLAAAGVETPSDLSFDYATAGNWFCVVATTDTGDITSGSGSLGSCGGVKAEYFNNITLSGSPVVTRTDPDIYYFWYPGSPGQGINADYFSARWTGYITAPVTANYNLNIYFDDRMRLYLDNVLVGDYWTSSCCSWYTLNYSFNAGEAIPIKVEISDSGGGASARMRWSYPGQVDTPIPSTSFSQSG